MALERFIDRPHHANPRSLIRANSMLLQFLEAQKQPDLNRLYQCMTALGTDPRALLILADHQYKLPELENLSNAYLEKPLRKKSAETAQPICLEGVQQRKREPRLSNLLVRRTGGFRLD